MSARAPAKVAFVHNLARGGARRVLAEHAQRLESDWQEFCLSTAAPISDRAHVTSYMPGAQRRHPLLRPPYRYADLLALFDAWRRLASAVCASGCDVAVVHSCQELQAPLALALPLVPSVYFCHEPRRVDYEPVMAGTRRSLTRPLYLPLYRLQRCADRAAVARASKLVTNSRFTASRIESAYGRAATPIPLGVPSDFTPLPTPARHLLSVGTLLSSKGHDLAIAAAARSSRRWPLVIVAPRPNPAEQERLQRLATAAGVTLEIRVAVSDAELRDLYRAALATLYLARAEPFGLVSLEAQACGSPVIVAAEGGLPETVIDGETGWAIERDPAAAAPWIDALAEPDLRMRVAAAAGVHGRRFDWDASTRALEVVIDSARGTRPQARASRVASSRWLVRA